MGRASHPTVLIVEDEAPVRRFIRAALRNGGYQVLEAATGEQALELARCCPAIELAVIDLLMPGMGGMELATELDAPPYPAPKVLYISGMQGSLAVDCLESGAPGKFLRKPFSANELLKRVRGLLEVESEDRADGAVAGD
jgi:two-component system KDP operon response regulator KdpE